MNLRRWETDLRRLLTKGKSRFKNRLETLQAKESFVNKLILENDIPCAMKHYALLKNSIDFYLFRIVFKTSEQLHKHFLAILKF